MKKYLLVLALSCLIVGPVRADDEMANTDEGMNVEEMDGVYLASNDGGDWAPPEVGHGEHKSGPCEKARLNDGQKAKLREARFKFMENEIDLQAQLKKAHLKLMKVMSDPASDIKAAESASQEVRESLSKVIAAKQDFKNQVNFKILKPEQREPAQMCAMHRHHFHRRYNRFANR